MQKIVLVKETLEELLKVMEIAIDHLEVVEDDIGIVRANIEVDETQAPLLIGAYGQTLGAFQAILKSLLWKKGLEEKSSVQLDINNYRKKQEDRILEIAQEKAESVRATNIPQALQPMSPFMRRFVHMHLAKAFPDLETESIGEEGKRRIQIRQRGQQNTDLEI